MTENKTGRKLELRRHTVRELIDDDLESYAGGEDTLCPAHTRGLCSSQSKEQCDTTICGTTK